MGSVGCITSMLGYCLGDLGRAGAKCFCVLASVFEFGGRMRTFLRGLRPQGRGSCRDVSHGNLCLGILRQYLSWVLHDRRVLSLNRVLSLPIYGNIGNLLAYTARVSQERDARGKELILGVDIPDTVVPACHVKRGSALVRTTRSFQRRLGYLCFSVELLASSDLIQPGSFYDRSGRW